MLKQYAAPALLLMLFQAPFCFGFTAAGINGIFYRNELSKPIAGALVALYKAETNLLVDYTYTTSNGQFTLKAPPEKGSYYLVATKDATTRQGDVFVYDPQGAPLKFDLRYEDKSSSWLSPTYVWGKFDWLITSLLGFGVGLLYKRYERHRDEKIERQKARQNLAGELVEIGLFVDKLVGNLDKLKQNIVAHGESGVGASEKIVADCRALLGESKKEAASLTTRLGTMSTVDANIFKAHGMKGKENFVRLKQALKELQEMAGDAQTVNALLDPDGDTQQEREKAREKLLLPFSKLSTAFAELKNNLDGQN